VEYSWYPLLNLRYFKKTRPFFTWKNTLQPETFLLLPKQKRKAQALFKNIRENNSGA
jgi:hypothetical protein